MEITDNEVHIWKINLKQSFQGCIGYISDEEQKRATKFYFKKHADRFKAAHIFTRIILAKYFADISPEELVFLTRSRGKPYLKDLNLEFNLTHSKNLAVLAVGKKQLGVDVEYFSKRDFFGIANKMFTKTEFENLNSKKNCVQPLSFYKIWSFKESYIKATGQGLYQDTQSFCVKDVAKEWKVVSFMPDLQCCGSLCCSKVVDKVDFFEF